MLQCQLFLVGNRPLISAVFPAEVEWCLFSRLNKEEFIPLFEEVQASSKFEHANILVNACKSGHTLFRGSACKGRLHFWITLKKMGQVSYLKTSEELFL